MHVFLTVIIKTDKNTSHMYPNKPQKGFLLYFLHGKCFGILHLQHCTTENSFDHNTGLVAWQRTVFNLTIFW